MKSITLYHRGIPIVHNPIAGTKYTIGSHPNNDLVLEGEGVAETHLVLQRGKDGCWRSEHSDYAGVSKLLTMTPGTKIEIGFFAVELREPFEEVQKTVEDLYLSYHNDLGMIGQSLQMLKLKSSLSKIAPLSAPVLITGETGTGKELAARALHKFSIKPDGPFVAVNCASLTTSMLEDVLFGHEKGAFTGAQNTHKGVFERAHGGTLFLDEIGELPANHQAALLRALDNGVIERIGSEMERKMDFRLITATNRNLNTMIDHGQFRRDLYHRIATFTVNTPPLRERPEDIKDIAQIFLRDMAEEVGLKELSEDAIKILEAYNWPGNVRELRNVLYRAAALCNGTVLNLNDFNLKSRKSNKACFMIQLKDISEPLLLELLTKYQGNITTLANELGVPRTTLRDKLKRMNHFETDNGLVI